MLLIAVMMSADVSQLVKSLNFSVRLNLYCTCLKLGTLQTLVKADNQNFYFHINFDNVCRNLQENSEDKQSLILRLSSFQKSHPYKNLANKV